MLMVKTRQEIERVVLEYIHNIERRGVYVTKVILYGSYAREGANDDSDIDIAVVSPTFSQWDILERQEFLGLSFGHIYAPIEPLGYSTEEYENAQIGSFLYEIKKTGKVIYEN
jgi:predicted nucleotidyltransferase